MAQSKDVSAWRKRRKLDLINVCGGKCQICGFDLFPEALEFHHEDPQNKSRELSTRGLCCSLECDLEEVKKCFLVCANCHRGIHSGYYENPKCHIFDEQVVEEILSRRCTVLEKKQHLCCDCGKLISYGAKRCVECSRKKRRCVERPSRDALKNDIALYGFSDLGRKYGVNGNTISKWCKSYGLPYKVSEIRKMSDDELAQI